LQKTTYQLARLLSKCLGDKVEHSARFRNVFCDTRFVPLTKTLLLFSTETTQQRCFK